jgi:two-component system NtrC family sensor kinase
MASCSADRQTRHEARFFAFFDVDRAGRWPRSWPVIKAALAGQGAHRNGNFPAAQLRRLIPLLAHRATPLIATPMPVPISAQMEDRGLVIHSAAPVRDADGRLLGVLEGGVLLNKNLDFIDRLNAIVYPDGTLPVGSAGTATCSSATCGWRPMSGCSKASRAIGTRVSAAVHAACSMKGEPGWTAPSSSMTGMSRPMNRCSIAMATDRHALRRLSRRTLRQARSKRFAMPSGFSPGHGLVAGVFAVIWARRVFKPDRAHACDHARHRTGRRP